MTRMFKNMAYNKVNAYLFLIIFKIDSYNVIKVTYRLEVNFSFGVKTASCLKKFII